MGLNYVRQDQTAPGADRLSAGPRRSAAGGASGRGGRAASGAGNHVWNSTRLPGPGFAPAAMHPGDSPVLLLKLIFNCPD